ncbi:Gluconate 2-dehydrogenase subunit 3 [Paracoccus isoporae]|uniref:Gluconate 2-dehydrogenase subunit 3 n=1 Tax=Paracoccus isoporae TaxID=591205 RepID=A0A1G7FBI7_9RHOB|nr:gluconate 2-dehydrogenase subunit 3 family protein [Paracoccus isoporae]SDE73216.1 Gluconate 2-dehydrogenase subunit 3 [Paracoccus isoporae]
MNRRELLSMIAAVTGTAMIAPRAGWSYQPTEIGENIFSPEDAAFLDEVAEIIIPQTDTPGAKDAGVGEFMTIYVSDCYDRAQQDEFRDAMEMLKTYAQDVYGADFMALEPNQQQVLIEDIASLARNQSAREGAEPHWFTAIHQLVLFGFFTSQPGATEVLRYEAVPGEFRDTDYDGGPAWAT